MKIAATSDLHGSLPEIEKCDLLLICGDISPLQIQRDINKMSEWMYTDFDPWIKGLDCDKVILIGGNHDFWLDANNNGWQTPSEAEQTWNNLPMVIMEKLVILNNSSYEYKGLKIYGTPECKWISNHWAFMNDGEQLIKVYDNIPEGLDILMTHEAPAIFGMNVSYESQYKPEFGSYQLANAISEKKPKYSFCGHIHSGEHEPKTFDGTTYVNVSYKNEKYDPAYNIYYYEFI